MARRLLLHSVPHELTRTIMTDRKDEILPTTEDDKREIATEGGKDAHNLRAPRDKAFAASRQSPRKAVHAPSPGASLNHPVKPNLGDGGEDELSGQPREAGGER